MHKQIAASASRTKSYFFVEVVKNKKRETKSEFLLKNEKIPQKQSVVFIENQKDAGMFLCFGSRLVSDK